MKGLNKYIQPDEGIDKIANPLRYVSQLGPAFRRAGAAGMSGLRGAGSYSKALLSRLGAGFNFKHPFSSLLTKIDPTTGSQVNRFTGLGDWAANNLVGRGNIKSVRNFGKRNPLLRGTTQAIAQRMGRLRQRAENWANNKYFTVSGEAPTWAGAKQHGWRNIGLYGMGGLTAGAAMMPDIDYPDELTPAEYNRRQLEEQRVNPTWFRDQVNNASNQFNNMSNATGDIADVIRRYFN